MIELDTIMYLIPNHDFHSFTLVHLKAMLLLRRGSEKRTEVREGIQEILAFQCFVYDRIEEKGEKKFWRNKLFAFL